jgi:redox-sensing transcriptional repressor
MSRRPATAGRSEATHGSVTRGGAGRAAGRRRAPGGTEGSAETDGTGRGGVTRGGSALGRGLGAGGQPAGLGHGIPDATVARLPVYLRALYALADRGVATVSSEELAAAAGVNSAKLRKDLSHLGSYGTRGVGYDVDYLVYQVSRELGLTQNWPVLIVGAGNLGRALANYGGFASRGFRIAALVDSDPAVVGSVIARHTVRSAADIEDIIRRFDVSIGVIATPATVAQNVCDRLVAAGVSSILNFAPVVLRVPSGVEVRKVDLSIELQILAFHAQRRGAAVPPPDRKRDGHLAGRRIDSVPLSAAVPGTASVPGGHGVRSEGLGGSVAELTAATRLETVAGASATPPNGAAGADYAANDHGSPDDYESGARAVGT